MRQVEIDTPQATGLIRRNATTVDGVVIHFVETGNPHGAPLIFVHGISQSWRSWTKQLADVSLRARFRLFALDLRGHGESQGACGAMDVDGNSVAPLAPDQYNDGTSDGTARLWASDIAAVIASCNLSAATLVGWSYGGAVVLDYLHVSGRLESVGKVVLLATTPVIRPPGTPDGGVDRIFSPRAATALMRTTPADHSAAPPRTNETADVLYGLTEYIRTCFADDTGRPHPTDQEVAAMTSFNLLTAPGVRMSVIGRAFDYRDFLARLPRSSQKKITVITPMGDKILQPANTSAHWPASNIAHIPVDNEGHLYFWRNPDDFRRILLSVVA
jgi:non-heme chloroperoxidase